MRVEGGEIFEAVKWHREQNQAGQFPVLALALAMWPLVFGVFEH